MTVSNISFNVSLLGPHVPYLKISKKLDSIEAFKEKGFIALNDKILKGTDQVYIYFYKGKPLIMISCDVLLKESLGEHFVYDYVSLGQYSNELNVTVRSQKTPNSIPYYQNILLDGNTLSFDLSNQENCSPEKLKKGLIYRLLDLGFEEQDLHSRLYFDPALTLMELKAKLVNELAKSKESLEKMASILKPMFTSYWKAHQVEVNKIEAERKANYFICSLESEYRKHFEVLERQIKSIKLDSSEPSASNTGELHQIQVFSKEIPGYTPRVFLVVFSGDKILNILTAVQNMRKSGKYEEVRGDILDVDLTREPTFILQKQNGGRIQLQLPFPNSHSSKASLFSVEQI